MFFVNAYVAVLTNVIRIGVCNVLLYLWHCFHRNQQCLMERKNCRRDSNIHARFSSHRAYSLHLIIWHVHRQWILRVCIQSAPYNCWNKFTNYSGHHSSLVNFHIIDISHWFRLGSNWCFYVKIIIIKRAHAFYANLRNKRIKIKIFLTLL